MGATVEKVALAYSIIAEFDSLTSSISARRMRGLSETPLQIEVGRHRYIEPEKYLCQNLQRLEGPFSPMLPVFF